MCTLYTHKLITLSITNYTRDADHQAKTIWQSRENNHNLGILFQHVATMNKDEYHKGVLNA